MAGDVVDAGARARGLGQRASHRAFGLPDIVVVAAVSLLGVGLPALVAVVTHSFAIPRNDDWAYLRVLSAFTTSGRYSLVGWGAMTLIGQVLWAAGFVAVLGNRAWVPSLAVAVAAVVGLASGYALARPLAGRTRAAAVALTLLVLPGFLLNTSTFMTDMPAFGAEACCLAMGSFALSGPVKARPGWLAASLFVGVLGFSVREFDLAAPVAVLAVAATADRRHLRRYALVAACLLGACGALYIWASGLVGAQQKSLALPSPSAWRALAGTYFTLGLAVAPWLPGAVRRRWRGAKWRMLAGFAVPLAIGIGLLAGRQPVLLGNYLSRSGAVGQSLLAGRRPELFSASAWTALELMAVVSGGCLGAVVASGRWGLARRLRQGALATALLEPAGLAWAFTALTAAGLVGYCLFVRAAMWDRLLWPLALGALVLLAADGRLSWACAPVRSGSQGVAAAAEVPRDERALAPRHAATARPARWRGCRHWAPPGVVAAVLVVVSIGTTLNSDAYDAARWSAGLYAVKAGYKAGEVDAGFEWVGDHATVVARPGRSVRGAPPYETWYDEMFPGFQACAVVSASPLGYPGLALWHVFTYDEVAFAGREKLYMYSVVSRRCALRRGGAL